jgi:hypothetical protein
MVLVFLHMFPIFGGHKKLFRQCRCVPIAKGCLVTCVFFWGRCIINICKSAAGSHVCGPIDTKVTTLGKDLVGIIATKFGLILFSGSQEEIQNVKSLQRDAK